MRRRRENSKRSRSDGLTREASAELAPPRLAATLPQADELSKSNWVFCPWLTNPFRESEIWTCVLAIHDINERVLTSLPPPGKTWSNVYAGIFAVDVLRTPTQVVRPIKAAGVQGVINFPSVSFIGDQAGTIFDQLSLGVAREVEFLGACAREGLRIAAVVRSVKAAHAFLENGADFLVVHNGPSTRSSQQTDGEYAQAIAEISKLSTVPVFRLSELIQRMHTGIERA